MKKFVVTIFLTALLLSSVCLAAEPGVVNHVMANKIECAPEKGCAVLGSTNVQIEIPKGQPGAKHTFSTLDQLIFDIGTFKVEQKIVEDATGNVVAAIKPNIITVKNNQAIRHFNLAWDFGAKLGSYTYQVVVDDKVIGAFKISILAGK